MFKNSKWLWKSKQFNINSYGHFIKTFNVEKLKKAILNITGHNHIKCYINGKLITGLVTPAPSSLSSKLYLTYDVFSCIKEGKNEIEVIVLYLGGSGQNYENGIPGFALELIINDDKEHKSVYSDETWFTIETTPYLDGMPYQQKRRITPVECFDSRSKTIVYKPVVVLDGYKKYEKQEIPEGKILKTIEPKLIYKHNDRLVYDCERIISGFPTIKVTSKQEQTLIIRYSEELENEYVKHNVANEYSNTYYDKIVVGKHQEVTHSFDFTYKAFRYLEIVYKENSINNLEIKVNIASTGFNIKGSLSSKTYPLIGQLFEMFKNTQHNNILGLLTDCPHREQAQYLGDSLLQSESIEYNVLERKELIEKVLKDFKESQYEDGSFPFVAPGSTNIEEFSLKIPEYDLYFIELLEKRYNIDNNKEILKKYYITAKKLIDGYIKKIDYTGLVLKNKEWHISDWPYPTVNNEGKYLCFENMLFYRQLKTFIELYKPEEKYLEIKEKLFKSINKTFKKNGLFIDCEGATDKHQGIQATAINNGFFKEEEKEKALNYIIKEGFGSSIILGRQVLYALFENNKTEAAIDYIFEYEKGWGSILRRGEKTMWEGFDDIESHSHAWGMYTVKILQKYLLGIKRDKHNINNFIIEPQFDLRIKDLKGSVVTLNGIIYFGYEIKENKFNFKYEIPEKTNVKFVCFNKEFILKGKGEFSI